jgi:hypothetical protein
MHKEAEAEGLFERALAGEKQRVGPPTFVTGLAEASLGVIAAHRNNTAQAEELFQTAVENLNATTAANDPRLISILEEYEVVLRADHRFGEAEQADVKAMRIRVRNALQNSDVRKN